jgi:hypothetical protein
MKPTFKLFALKIYIDLKEIRQSIKHNKKKNKKHIVLFYYPINLKDLTRTAQVNIFFFFKKINNSNSCLKLMQSLLLIRNGLICISPQRFNKDSPSQYLAYLQPHEPDQSSLYKLRRSKKENHSAS